MGTVLTKEQRLEAAEERVVHAAREWYRTRCAWLDASGGAADAAFDHYGVAAGMLHDAVEALELEQ
jgi:hypothetical protein